MTSITILYIVLAAIIAFVMAFFHYVFKDKKKKHLLLALLRFLSIFTILLLLINPKIKSEIFEEIKPSLQVVADNSSSIKFMDADKTLSEIISQIKDSKAIQEKFNVNYYSFSDDLYPDDSLTFSKPETDILKTLETLKSLSDEESSAILLLSDGNQTYGSDYEYHKSNQAIYPIVLGDTVKHEDVKINKINVNKYTNLNNQFPVEVFVQYDGVQSIESNFSVRQNNKLVFQKTVRLSAENNIQRIQFDLVASSVGIHNYQCAISPLANEKNSINNRQNFSIDVIDEQSKVLILSDIKHPDISMIKRSIETNKQRKVSIVTNLSKPIKLQDYQLIIAYQPNRKFESILKEGLSKNVNFFIITGAQTDWSFLNNAQPYFKKNFIEKTEIYNAQFNSDFNEFIIDESNFDGWPPLTDKFGQIKFSVPHQVLLYQTVSNIKTENPLLVTLEDGSKRAAVLFGENSWKWRMYASFETQSFEKFDSFFNKLTQYLSSNKRSRQLEIAYKPFVHANLPVSIMAQYFDANYNFDATASLVLKVTHTQSKKKQEIPFTLKENTFEAVLNGLDAGDYTFVVETGNQSIKKNGAFTVLDYEIEKQFLTANVEKLTKIAQQSNGGIFYKSTTDKLLENLLADNRYQTVQRSSEKIVSLIEWKWLLGLVVLFLSLEWFLRKYRGLI